jgi:hypothetical protein
VLQGAPAAELCAYPLLLQVLMQQAGGLHALPQSRKLAPEATLPRLNGPW